LGIQEEPALIKQPVMLAARLSAPPRRKMPTELAISSSCGFELGVRLNLRLEEKPVDVEPHRSWVEELGVNPFFPVHRATLIAPSGLVDRALHRSSLTPLRQSSRRRETWEWIGSKETAL